jgi:hypothetical protein
MNALLHLNPVFWLILTYVCGSGVEWLSSIRRFRKLQSKYPRFTYLKPEDKEVDWILGSTFFIMIISGVMEIVSLFGATKGELIAVFAVLPVIICLMIIGDKVNLGKQIVNWKSIGLLGTLTMELGSIGTTLWFYLCLYYSNIKTMTEFTCRATELTIASVVGLLGVFIVLTIFELITERDCKKDPVEGHLEFFLKLLPVFNPILSPITIPLAIVIIPTFSLGRWAIRLIKKIVIKIKQKKVLVSAVTQ